MKILLVGRSTYHFSYYESIVRELLHRGVEVVLYYDKQWSENHPDVSLGEFLKKNPEVRFKWAPRRADGWRKFVFPMRELSSYANYLSRKDQSRFYLDRWEKYLTPILRGLVKVPLAKFLLKTRFLKVAFELVEKLIPACSEIKKVIANENPDVLLASPVNMRFSEEVEFVKAANDMGIPTVVHVLSWDNLTTKGLIHAKPSLLLVWNQTHYDESKNVHGFNEDNLAITGSPFS